MTVLSASISITNPRFWQMPAQNDMFSITLSYCLRQSSLRSSAPGPMIRILEPTRSRTPKVVSSCPSSIARRAGLSSTMEPSARLTLFAVMVGTSFSFIDESEPTSSPSSRAFSPIWICFSISAGENFLEWFIGQTPSTASRPQPLKYSINFIGSLPAVGTPKENPSLGENFILNFFASAPNEGAAKKPAHAAAERAFMKSRLCMSVLNLKKRRAKRAVSNV